MDRVISAIIGLIFGVLFGVPWGAAISHTDPEDIEKWSEEDGW